MSPNGMTWVGMDAHKNSIKVAAFTREQPEPLEWTEDTTPEAIRRPPVGCSAWLRATTPN